MAPERKLQKEVISKDCNATFGYGSSTESPSKRRGDCLFDVPTVATTISAPHNAHHHHFCFSPSWRGDAHVMHISRIRDRRADADGACLRF